MTIQSKEFCNKFECSTEIFEKLEHYHTLLLKWQKAINLVSPNTLDEVWRRHFYDSAQLSALIPTHVSRVADLGSGAGFPGLVLAIMRPDLEIHLIESDERKAQFLRTVSRETQSGAQIHNERVERALGDVGANFITARALAALPKLLGFVESAHTQTTNPDAENGTESIPEMIFLKGREHKEEVILAQKLYDFDLTAHPSQTSKESRLLHIKNLKKR